MIHTFFTNLSNKLQGQVIILHIEKQLFHTFVILFKISIRL